MPLFEFTNKNKYGQLRKRIIYNDSTAFSFNPKGLGDFVCVRPFKYQSRSPYFGILSINGKKYLTPDWIEVLPETTMDDIKPFEEENRGRPKKVERNDEWKFESSSSDVVYTVRQVGVTYKCNCPGVWRAKDRRCKHIKEVEKL